jgi:translation initiation factor IF-2
MHDAPHPHPHLDVSSHRAVPGVPAGRRHRRAWLLATLAVATVPASALVLSAAPASAATRDHAQTSGSSYRMITGAGCKRDKQVSFSEHGWYVDKRRGFIAVAKGSLRSSRCNGSFDAMPMSGSYAIYTFRTSPVHKGICQVRVYIPHDSSTVHVGGDPAHYQVFASATATGKDAGWFTIRQHAHLGRWVDGGNYWVSGGALTVKLHSRGIDYKGSKPDFAHIAVSPIRVSCLS